MHMTVKVSFMCNEIVVQASRVAAGPHTLPSASGRGPPLIGSNCEEAVSMMTMILVYQARARMRLLGGKDFS